jgi:multidrug efflux system membrane fusion protein
LSAIVEPPSGKGDFAVYTLTGVSGDGIAHLLPVGVGEMVGNRVVVRHGLVEGQKVITSGATLLHDGQHVRVTP